MSPSSLRSSPLMSRATMYRRSRTIRASFQAKNAFSGVPTGNALAPRRDGNDVIDRTRTDTGPE